MVSIIAGFGLGELDMLDELDEFCEPGIWSLGRLLNPEQAPRRSKKAIKRTLLIKFFIKINKLKKLISTIVSSGI